MLMKEVEVIILAGGRGLRMGELTRNKQKCLLPIDGEPILAHIFYSLLIAFGSVDIKLSVNFKQEQVKKFANKFHSKKLTTTCIPHPRNSQTLGAYKAVREHIKGPFVGMPGDVITRPAVYANALETFEKKTSEATLTFSPNLKEVDTHAVGKIQDGLVIELIKLSPNQIPDFQYLRDMNIYASDQNFFRLINNYPNKERSLSKSLARALADRHIFSANHTESPWIHIAYPDDLNKTLKHE